MAVQSEDAETKLLFVYGSLMPELGLAPFGLPQRQRLASESVPVGRAAVDGTLYDLGEHPCMITPPARSGDVVHGTVLSLLDPEKTFAWLDEFEDFDASRPEELNYYVREIIPVRIGDRLETAWIYIVRRVPPGSHRIRTGKWHAPSPKPDLPKSGV